ncbi:MAG TPA: TIGR03435 family protein [Acidobacteriaceae bacterium]
MGRIRIAPLLLTVLLAGQLPAQSTQPPAKPLAFEAADIHPSPFSFGEKYFHVAPYTGTRFVAHQATPLDLINSAYKVETDAVTGGPPGLAFDRYDIVARLPPGATEADTPRLLQSLLTDRFKLAVESQTKPLPAYLLTLGKGANKMKPAADTSAPTGCRYHPDSPDAQPPPTVTLNCINVTMAQFADALRDFGQSLDHPVIDRTGLSGAWDFDFIFTWQRGTPDGLTLFDSVDKIGLKLEAGTAPRPAIAITSMADAPTPNVAGIEKVLPPPPLPSFDVAVIRPNKSEYKDVQARVTGSQLTITATELRLVAFAWDSSVKMVFDGPPFFDNQVWEITAKLPVPDVPLTPGARPRIDPDQIRLMMRTLLAERFGLKAHTENRPGLAYTLYTGTPRLKPANPANRASCTDHPSPGEKDPSADNPYLTSYTRCNNVTMDQFAREFQAYSGYIIKSPVLNQTGIQGRYDLTLTFTALHTLESLGIVPNAHGETPTAGGVGGAPGEPAGVPVMLTDAVSKQTGLKLVYEKRPISVLVVDHIEEKPTDN